MRRAVGCSIGCLLLMLAGCESSHSPGDGGGRTDGPVRDSGRDSAVGDGGSDPFACAGPSECIVVPASCCGSCGAATRGDAVAVNVARSSDYRRPMCDGVGCPACFMEQDPSLVATCRAGRCEVADLHTEPAAECSSDGDCRVRTRDCCECGGDVSRAGIIAIATSHIVDYEALVCDPGTACLECAPVYPAEVSAVCSSAGFCDVVWAGSP